MTLDGEIAKQYPYRAMMEDGRWFAFQSKPFILGSEWTTGKSDYIDLQQYGSIDNVNWKESLIYEGMIKG